MKGGRPLTDRRAIVMALYLAIEAEESLIEAHSGEDWWPEDAKANTLELNREVIERCNHHIAAFKRVLERYFGGHRKHPLDNVKPITLAELLALPVQPFKGPGEPRD